MEVSIKVIDALEFTAVGRLSTRVFQMLSEGKIVHPLVVGLTVGVAVGGPLTMIPSNVT